MLSIECSGICGKIKIFLIYVNLIEQILYSKYVIRPVINSLDHRF